MVCAYYRTFDVPRLYRCVLYALLFTAESHHPGDAESIVAGTDDAPECDGDAVYRHVDAVRLVTVFILLVSFGGGTASAFFNKLTLMANVSMTLPYLFLALAFPFFKARQDLDRPFVIFKTRMSAMIATVVVVLVVTFANVFTIIQPVVEAGDWDSTLWMIGGPVFFSLLAMAIYQNYCSRMANKPELALD